VSATMIFRGRLCFSRGLAIVTSPSVDSYLDVDKQRQKTAEE